jgi:hypothetical protein
MVNVSDEMVKATCIRILDLVEDGKYAYEEGVKKSRDQININRELNVLLNKILLENPSKRSVRFLQEAILNLDVPRRLRDENKMLRQRVKHFEERGEDYKECIKATYLDEIRMEERERLDKDREERLESSCRVNRKLIKTIEKLEDQLAASKSGVSQDEHERIRQQLLDALEQNNEMRKKNKLNKEALKIAQILKLSKSSSSDSISETIYSDDEQE